MNNYIKEIGVLIGVSLLGLMFYLGFSCHKCPPIPAHTAEVKIVGSAAISAKAADSAISAYKIQIAPTIQILKDSISLLVKKIKPANEIMSNHIVAIKALSNELQDVKDSSESFKQVRDSLLYELASSIEDYNVQQNLKDELSGKQQDLISKNDSLQLKLDSAYTILKSSLHATQGAFNTVITQDKTASSDLKLYKTAMKLEAAAIAVLVLTIFLKK